MIKNQSITKTLEDFNKKIVKLLNYKYQIVNNKYISYNLQRL